MDNKTIKIIGGIVTLLAVLGSGIIWHMVSIGERTACRAGWIYEPQGEYEGYYKCITSTNMRYELCFNVYDSANTKDYWCEKGKVIKVEDNNAKLDLVNITYYNGIRWLCIPDECMEAKK